MLRMNQVNLVETLDHVDLEQQRADAGVPGAVNPVQAFERAACLRRRQGRRPRHMQVKQRLHQPCTCPGAGQ